MENQENKQIRLNINEVSDTEISTGIENTFIFWSYDLKNLANEQRKALENKQNVIIYKENIIERWKGQIFAYNK